MSFVRLSLVSVAVRYFERCVFFVQIIAQSLFQIFQVDIDGYVVSREAEVLASGSGLRVKLLTKANLKASSQRQGSVLTSQSTLHTSMQ